MSDDSYELLSKSLSNLFTQAMEILAQVNFDSDSLTVELPTGKEMEDMDPTSIAHKVALTSNNYSKAARLSGIVKAELKKAQAVYKDSFKLAKDGKNEVEREKNAILATRDEARRLYIAEQVSAVAEAVENAARVSSESSRKLLDKIEAVQKADYREQHGQKQMTYVSDSDF